MSKFFESVLGSEQKSKDMQETRYIEAQRDLNADYIRSQEEFTRDFHRDIETHVTPVKLYPAFSFPNMEMLGGKYTNT
jgi:hypothetical protein